MERSTNYNFYLPSRDTDDIADINQISDNFRIVDTEMKVLNDAVKYVSSAGARYSNYYYDVYKHTVLAADALIAEADLTNPYYYYILEGWTKCSSISDDNLIAYFYPEFQTIENEILNGSDFFYGNGGRWVAIPQVLCLGTMNRDDNAFNPRDSFYDSLVKLNANLTGNYNSDLVSFVLTAKMMPTTSTFLKFKNNDVDMLTMYFKIKLDQRRKTSVG